VFAEAGSVKEVGKTAAPAPGSDYGIYIPQAIAWAAVPVIDDPCIGEEGAERGVGESVGHCSPSSPTHIEGKETGTLPRMMPGRVERDDSQTSRRPELRFEVIAQVAAKYGVVLANEVGVRVGITDSEFRGG
jgi:hypothetical protein